MTNKRQGRVGDSPIIGAGTYAKNGVCAVSATGHGEYFIRAVAAYHICCAVEYRGLTLAEAAHEVIHKNIRALGGTGGVIAVDAAGGLVTEFSTEGMFRGTRDARGRREIAIYRDEATTRVAPAARPVYAAERSGRCADPRLHFVKRR